MQLPPFKQVKLSPQSIEEDAWRCLCWGAFRRGADRSTNSASTAQLSDSVATKRERAVRDDLMVDGLPFGKVVNFVLRAPENDRWTE